MTHALKMDFGDADYIFLDEENKDEIEAFKSVFNLPTNTTAIRINNIELDYFVKGE